jgi:hypothetical protein
MIAARYSVLALCAALAGRATASNAIAAAQDTTGVGSVSGVVADASGTPIAFATICVATTTQCVMADGRGSFRFENLRPGERVEVSDSSMLSAELTHSGIPARKSALFSHREHISVIRRTRITSSNSWVPESEHDLVDALDFERGGEEFDPRAGTGSRLGADQSTRP